VAFFTTFLVFGTVFLATFLTTFLVTAFLTATFLTGLVIFFGAALAIDSN